MKLPDLSGISVLVVDDEADCLAIMAAIVESCGGIAHSALSSADALRQCDQHRVDVVVSDIGMPGGDGYTLLRKLRDAGHLMPAVAVSGYTASEDKRATLRAGFYDHVNKPCTPQELGTQILMAYRYHKLNTAMTG